MALRPVSASQKDSTLDPATRERIHRGLDELNLNSEEMSHHDPATEEKIRRVVLKAMEAQSYLRAEDPSQALLKIASTGRGDAELIKALLVKGADPNISGWDGRSALMCAVTQHRMADFEVLLQGGANPDAVDNHGRTALMLAAEFGDLAMVEALLQKGADPNLRDASRYSALYQAIRKKHPALIKALKAAGAQDIDSLDNFRGELVWAVKTLSVREVLVALARGADPNFKGDIGDTALMHAALREDTEMVNALIDAGADPNIADKYGQTALMNAVISGRAEVVEALINAGANPNAVDTRGQTALMFAGNRRRVAIVKMLLDKGADPNIRGEKGETLLISASREGYPEIVGILTEKSDLNIRDSDGKTALAHAVCAEDRTLEREGKRHPKFLETIKILLDAGADPNVFDSDEWSDFPRRPILWAAARRRDIEVVDMLLQNGADPDAVNQKDGYTSLVLAVVLKNIECVKLCLQGGASHLKKNSYEENALEIAERYVSEDPNNETALEIRNLLVEYAKKCDVAERFAVFDRLLR